MIFPDFRYGSQSFPDFLRIDQGIVQPPAKAAAAHGGYRFIEDIEKGAHRAVILNGFEEFEIPLRRFIENETLGRRVPLDSIDMQKLIFLGFLHIAKNGACGSNDRRIIPQARTFQVLLGKGGLQAAQTRLPIKIIGRKFIKTAAIFSPGKDLQKTVPANFLGKND